MNKLLFGLIIVLCNACIVNKSTSTKGAAVSKKQTALINESSSNDPMRVLLITNEKDSLILRQSSSNFKLPKDSVIANKLANRMLATVTSPANLGVGIAAPQVGVLKNLILVQRFDVKGMPFEAYYNPVITKFSKLKQPCLEGCLSIPNRMDTTRNRAYAILLEYDKLDGSHQIEMIEDFTAVIFQHEIDHLNGILYLDHLDKEIRDAEEKLKFNNHLKE